MDPTLQSLSLIMLLWHLFPEMVLGAAACLLFLGGTVRQDRNLWGTVALVSLLLAGLALAFTESGARPVPAAIYSIPITLDALTLLSRVLALCSGGILLLLSWNEVPDRQAAEHHACLLIIVAGVGLTAAANDLVTLFLALELISIPTYVLLYLPRYDDASQEAALKYFLLSVFSSAI